MGHCILEIRTHSISMFGHCISCSERPHLVAAGIAPYMALELGLFDLMPRDLAPFMRGFSSALMATTLCYPLDTVRWSPCFCLQISSPQSATSIHGHDALLPPGHYQVQLLHLHLSAIK